MSDKPEDRDPKRWEDQEAHRAADRDAQGEALAECYRILMDAGAIKPKDEGTT